NLPGIPSEFADLSQSTASILDQSMASILDQNTVVLLNQSTASILDQSTASILDIRQVPQAFGHGTMVAGIIHLVAPTAQIMPLKDFKVAGTSNLFDILRAIYYAVNHGAKVINLSCRLGHVLQHAFRFRRRSPPGADRGHHGSGRCSRRALQGEGHLERQRANATGSVQGFVLPCKGKVPRTATPVTYTRRRAPCGQG